jgi:biopolymer transport protein ExbD
MATLNISSNSKAGQRAAKSLPSVDLTAMVDLAFLLITFFMLTTSLTNVKAIDIAKPIPIESELDFAAYPASRTMTILLGKHNKIVYYMGQAEFASMKISGLTTIKSEILANKLIIQKTHQTAQGKRMLVIIKPTVTSVYKNFVDIIDEMNINGIDSYAIDDKYINEKELAFMKNNGI